MSDWGIEEKGFDTLELQLKQAADLTPLTAAMKEALVVVQQEAMRFPPAPPYPPAGKNTWVREVGGFSRSHFITGTGKRRSRIGGGRMYRASEKMLAKWKSAQPQITVTPNGIEGRISNDASYGPLVQGEQQTRTHAKNGWLTTQAILAKQQARIIAVFERALQSKLAQGE